MPKNKGEKMETIYVEKSWLGWAVWTYSDGERYFLGHMGVNEIERYAKKYDYRIIWVD